MKNVGTAVFALIFIGFIISLPIAFAFKNLWLILILGFASPILLPVVYGIPARVFTSEKVEKFFTWWFDLWFGPTW